MIARTCRPSHPAAKRVARELGPAANESRVLHAAQAAEVVLAAIARSDGTRASVLREIQATRVRGGILGTFRFDRNGDITPAKLPVLRVTGARARASNCRPTPRRDRGPRAGGAGEPVALGPVPIHG